jgi:hypothetical protein
MTGDAGLPRFWQPRFHDFNVYSRYKLRQKLAYMHKNPVKRGLAKNSGEWIWSSFWFYEKGELGLVKIDPVRFPTKPKSQTPRAKPARGAPKIHFNHQYLGHPLGRR